MISARRAAIAPLASSAARWPSIASRSATTPSPDSAQLDSTGTCQSPLRADDGPIASIDLRSAMVLFASGRSHLLTTWMSAISRMPALIAWMSSPRPGAETTTVVCAARATSTSSWPTPTVSMITTS